MFPAWLDGTSMWLQGKVAEDHWELRLELWARAICLNARLRLYPEVHREPQVPQGRSSF